MNWDAIHMSINYQSSSGLNLRRKSRARMDFLAYPNCFTKLTSSRSHIQTPFAT